jgi:hypothetical protein
MKQLIGDRGLSDALAECDEQGLDALPLAAKEMSRLFPHLWTMKKSAEHWSAKNPPEPSTPCSPPARSDELVQGPGAPGGRSGGDAGGSVAGRRWGDSREGCGE